MSDGAFLRCAPGMARGAPELSIFFATLPSVAPIWAEEALFNGTRRLLYQWLFEDGEQLHDDPVCDSP